MNLHLKFCHVNPLILLSLLVTVILNIFRCLIHPWYNITLELLNLLLKTALIMVEKNASLIRSGKQL